MSEVKGVSLLGQEQVEQLPLLPLGQFIPLTDCWAKPSHPSPVAVMVQRPEPFSLSPAAFSLSDSPLLNWVYFGFELIDGLAFITRLTTRGLLKVICNVNTFVIKHIFFRLRLTFMNIKAL